MMQYYGVKVWCNSCSETLSKKEAVWEETGWMPLDCGQSFQSLCFRVDVGGVVSMSFTNLCVLSRKKLDCWNFFLDEVWKRVVKLDLRLKWTGPRSVRGCGEGHEREIQIPGTSLLWSSAPIASLKIAEDPELHLALRETLGGNKSLCFRPPTWEKMTAHGNLISV